MSITMMTVQSASRAQSMPKTYWCPCCGSCGSSVAASATPRKTPPASSRNSASYSCRKVRSGRSRRASSISLGEMYGLSLVKKRHEHQSPPFFSCPIRQSFQNQLCPFGVEMNRAMPNRSLSAGRIASRHASSCMKVHSSSTARSRPSPRKDCGSSAERTCTDPPPGMLTIRSPSLTSAPGS